MLNLFRFLCVCTLGFLPLVGCSEGGGSGVTDDNCGTYCAMSAECFPIDEGSCLESCANESATEAALSQPCATAASEQRACLGASSCAEVASWGWAPERSPCSAEFSEFETQCTPSCRSGDDCDDGRECSGDWCDEGSCRYELSHCPCEAPLSELCERSDCPSWDDAVASTSCTPTFFLVDVGRCGDFRYIGTYWGYDDAIDYFDASGTMVAGSQCTDTPSMACSPGHSAFCIHSGPVPDCERQREEILCQVDPL
jgi:hypothetical protein